MVARNDHAAVVPRRAVVPAGTTVAKKETAEPSLLQLQRAAGNKSYDLPFDHGLTVAEGDALHVFARFGLFDGDAAVAALASVDPSPAS